MNIAETETVMRRAYENRSSPASPILLDGDSIGDSIPLDQTEAGARRGRVATMLTHDGTASLPRWSRARYCDGVTPTISVNRELNEPSDVQPTVTHVSVTDIP